MDITKNSKIDDVSPLDRRQKIMDVEECIKQIPGSLGADPYELLHHFAKGVYVREITLPADQYIVSKIHKHEHFMIFLSGDVTIISEVDGKVRINTPQVKISPPGAKRALYTHAETRILTIHATDETDIKKIEDECMAKDFTEIDQLEVDEMQNIDKIQ